jgi:phosphoglycerol transferase MdoB-like AlkP superfamily enzyme
MVSFFVNVYLYSFIQFSVRNLLSTNFHKNILYALLVLLAFYMVCRVVFITYNYVDLKQPEGSEILWGMVYGLRFDISAILLSNLIFILAAYFMGYRGGGEKGINVIKSFFIVSNTVFILLNFIDTAYFPFVQRRLHSDSLLFITGDKGWEILNLLPVFLWQYAYLWLIFGVVCYLFYRISNRIFNRWRKASTGVASKSVLSYSLGLVFWLLIILTGVRGGWQLRPLQVINASEMAGVDLAPAVLNSTFSLLKTLNKKTLHAVTYAQKSALEACNQGIPSSLPPSGTYQGKNVVVLIVESLSKQYISYFNGRSSTPFLDSIMGEGMVFPNAFANARESVQGIPAIMASVPSWMDEAFIFSAYANNKINSLPGILAAEGYHTSFFHGAATGTMGFNSFCQSAGIAVYSGKEDYPFADRDFDGHWGIWDHAYLPWMASRLNDFPQPFFASVLTLNSHHPFSIPDAFNGQFKRKGHPVLSSISYADHALRLFFKEAEKQPWFTNTLFVITADHTGPNTDVMKTRMDDYRIPLLFFQPQHAICGLDTTIVNQVDLMPTILSLLGYNKPYFTVGQNVFSPLCEPHAIQYNAGVFYYATKRWFFMHNGEKPLSLYAWPSDRYLRKNLLYNPSYRDTIQQLSSNVLSRVSFFHQALIADKMSIQSYVRK